MINITLVNKDRIKQENKTAKLLYFLFALDDA